MARLRDAVVPDVAKDSSRLDELLVQAVFDAEAHIGVVYTIAGNGHVLTMQTAIGLPAMIAKAWARVRRNDQVPVSVAVRERRLIWLSGREALARGFPAAALALPYHFALAAAPICSDATVQGGILLAWPTGRAGGLTPRQLHVIDSACARMGELLRQADERGRPVTAGPQPRVLDPHPARGTHLPADSIAVECLNRLPEGFCFLDAHGRVSLVTTPATALLATEPTEMIGRRLCKALPWVDDPACEDQYRAAIVSHQTTHFTARNPEGRQLLFQCYPGLPGVTLRITPNTAEPDPASRTRRPRVFGLHETLHLATALARAITVHDVIDLAADHVLPLHNAQAMAILTWRSGRIRVVASHGYSRQAIEKFNGRPVINQASAARDHERGQPVFCSTWHELRHGYLGAIRADGMSAWAFLPLVTSGRPIGTCVLAYDRPHLFTTDERAALTALSGLIAQAFERAQLYDSTNQIAQCLQSNLLPRDLPHLPGLELAARYVPATPGMDIGGDFYDLIQLSDTRSAAVIADVQGHDVTAAALMGQVRTAIHAHATAGVPPGDVLAHTNRLMNRLAPDRFTSCIYLTIDLERHTACLANAGHLPPLLSRPGRPAHIIDTPPGLLLGIDPDAAYTSEVALPPGSVLALYTDGLIEQPGLDLGEAISGLAHRFTPAPGLPLRQLAQSLIDDSPARHRMDDIALLLLRPTATSS
ncbi:SpoIIE family protein phosphatase [Nonomuraea zeae]|uniref:protein-serine/threonine phosphatase n=1 Tax=Nonomuraea zeae TaxID=1642303 RepID=A0A5S4GZD3_9ACTN|nr:SpoIIE family protein phosphatase [Nonomuraea zeae]TMR38267.1 GAF domain-containing protein [Nonomuraea zeae]